ncbi:MAG: GNAT family N-acetyltransferase [Bacteroidia bacterium]|nr:GNAT family N-acetyltransferase [Bacteroidia bacterium]
MTHLRQADIADIMLIHEMAQDVFLQTYKEILSPEQLTYMLKWMYAPTNIRKQMEEGHKYFIVYADKELAGYASIEQEEKDLFHLQKLYILPHFQGKHLGREVFHKLISYIKSIHPTPCRLELNVNRNNPALHFYERLGMKKLREGDFPIGQGYFMTDYIMGLEL